MYDLDNATAAGGSFSLSLGGINMLNSPPGPRVFNFAVAASNRLGHGATTSSLPLTWPPHA